MARVMENLVVIFKVFNLSMMTFKSWAGEEFLIV
jgi:hypothetical protein